MLSWKSDSAVNLFGDLPTELLRLSRKNVEIDEIFFNI